MQAINPFLVLGIDEAATRAEIDAAYRQLAGRYHPDRHATSTPEQQRAAAERMAAITYAHQLLTDPKVAAVHKAKFHRVRAAGIHVEPAPQRPREDVPVEATKTDGYKRSALREFTIGRSSTGTPWTARTPRRWFRRR